MIDLYYINSKGARLNLVSRPYHLQTGDIFDYGWSYSSVTPGRYGGAIIGFSKEVKEKTLTLTVEASSQRAYRNALDEFFVTADYDIAHMSPGRLYINGQYMFCYIYASEKVEWEYGIESLDNTIHIVTGYPFWITERKYSFYPESPSNSDGSRDYPYGYPYGYKTTGIREYLTNTHYSPVPFTMQIFGPCINPRIEINKHVYEVLVTLQKDEYLDICALVDKHTVYKIKRNGEQINCFNLRNWKSSLFEPIPEDVSTVEWDGSFGFDITLFEERSEPRWT